MTRNETGEFQGSAGRVFWQAWLPDGEPRAVAVIVHGYAEHSGRYAHVAARLNDAGIAAYALDHIGHGRSDGGNANVVSLDSAADNVQSLLNIAVQEHPGLPRFVIGHSMGGLTVAYLATRAPLDVTGVVLSGPAIVVDAGNAVQRLFAPLVSRLAPNLPVVKLDSNLVSRDAEVVRAYDTDPMVWHGGVPARTATEMLRAGTFVLAHLNQLTVPLLVQHGAADGLASPEGADLLERDAASKDKTVIRYDGLFHEIYNEPEQDKVISDLVTWLQAHIDAA
ncbi:alpha/beta fold hydrolase [Nocardia sp. SYP-A9097]|uniref:alpha/beta hydrolase n=1 Tax=Nocardia sp. SYP-A9097 TaxID=2663237 RepID=UPI00129A0C92|nr:alpha/beta hydrolase [Nocardia sp. SYP-A9097]MRH92054.1 alpha/beta fold hydrolase [Nocardia sp. SYP-A9097]